MLPAGHTRLLLAKKPEGPFAAYEKLEYVLPDAEVAAFAKALAKPEELSRFEVYQENTSSVRDRVSPNSRYIGP